MSTDLKPATTHQWSLGIDRQTGKQSVLRVSYVGSKGTHLLRPTAINNPVPGTVPTGTNVNALRPIAAGERSRSAKAPRTQLQPLQVSLHAGQRH
jgi:hypothetical protein